MSAATRIRYARALFVMVVLALVYVTAIPFRLAPWKGFAARIERSDFTPFFAKPARRISGSDTIGNILLFLPVGFALQGWRQERRRGQKIRMLPTVAATAGFSLAIELCQFFLRDRFTSVNDFIMNVAGAAAGAWLAHRCYSSFIDLTFARWQALKQRPGILVLGAAITCYLIWMLLPFNFSPTTDAIQRKWHQWQYSISYLRSLPGETLTLSRWELWPLVALENFLFAGLVSGLLVLCRRWYWRQNPQIFWSACLSLFCLFPLLAVAQFLVRGSNPDLLPLLAAFTGTAWGLIAMSSLTKEADLFISARDFWRSHVGRVLAINYLLFFLLLLLRPDLPDFRVNDAANGAETEALAQAAGFFACLLQSVHPTTLDHGGSAVFRLFIKLGMATIPPVFILLTMKPRALQTLTKNNLLIIVLLSFASGLFIQALRFWLLHANVSLIAMAAITAGTMAAIWLENWWQRGNKIAAAE